MPRYRSVEGNHRTNNVILALLLALVAILAFGMGLAVGRLWNGGLASPAPITPAAQIRTSNPAEESTPSLTPAAPLSPTSDSLTTAPPTSGDVLLSTPTKTPQPFIEGPFVYGYSVNENDLRAYRLGTGPSARALIGGIHGGYEWNTTVLVSDTLAYLQENLDLIPPNVTLYIIPCANPDGAAAGTDAVHGRMNGNGVDLNRNWDYHWQMTATHGTRPVSAGAYAFSEPETASLRDFIFERNIETAIFYHSAMSKIFSGADRERSATFELAEMMSEATGYPHSLEGVPGQITTGDAIDYLSTKGVAAIEIELTTHEDIEWDRNWQGVLAFLNWTIPIEEGGFIRYTVQLGDTLLGIALQHDGVEVEDILAANDDIVDEDQIIPGQVILIPTKKND